MRGVGWQWSQPYLPSAKYNRVPSVWIQVPSPARYNGADATVLRGEQLSQRVSPLGALIGAFGFGHTDFDSGGTYHKAEEDWLSRQVATMYRVRYKENSPHPRKA